VLPIVHKSFQYSRKLGRVLGNPGNPFRLLSKELLYFSKDSIFRKKFYKKVFDEESLEISIGNTVCVDKFSKLKKK